jgi:hypothetical protein
MCRRYSANWCLQITRGGDGGVRLVLLSGKARRSFAGSHLRVRRVISGIVSLCVVQLAAFCATAAEARANSAQDNEPIVTKVEPPNWWLGMTPEVMVLLTGRGLEATKVECNLTSILVERTQSTTGGNYLFVWLKFGPETKSGTAVCRVTAPTGVTSFELPLAARAETIHKFQGVTPNDVIYLIMPDRFANGDPTNDEPADARGSHDRAKARAYHGGDLRGIQNHLEYLKDLGVTTVWLTPILRFVRRRPASGNVARLSGVGERGAPAADEDFVRHCAESCGAEAPVGGEPTDGGLVSWDAPATRQFFGARRKRKDLLRGE